MLKKRLNLGLSRLWNRPSPVFATSSAKATGGQAFNFKSDPNYLKKFELLWKTASRSREVLPSQQGLLPGGSSRFSALKEVQSPQGPAISLANRESNRQTRKVARSIF